MAIASLSSTLIASSISSRPASKFAVTLFIPTPSTIESTWLLLLGIKHDSELDSIEQATARRIRQHDLHVGDLRFEVSRHSRYRPSRAGSGDKGMQPSSALPKNFWPRSLVVSLPVGSVLELICKVASALTVWVSRVFGGQLTGAVDEVLRINDGSWRDSVDDCPELKEQIFFLGRLVRGHTSVTKKSAGPPYFTAGGLI